jgi:hypothetical protein
MVKTEDSNCVCFDVLSAGWFWTVIVALSTPIVVWGARVGMLVVDVERLYSYLERSCWQLCCVA